MLARYGIEAERKSIYSDIEALQQYGLDVELQRGRGGGYYVASRAFELPELKLLVDAIQCSRFITEKIQRADQEAGITCQRAAGAYPAAAGLCLGPRQDHERKHLLQH